MTCCTSWVRHTGLAQVVLWKQKAPTLASGPQAIVWSWDYTGMHAGLLSVLPTFGYWCRIAIPHRLWQVGAWYLTMELENTIMNHNINFDVNILYLAARCTLYQSTAWLWNAASTNNTHILWVICATCLSGNLCVWQKYLSPERGVGACCPPYPAHSTSTT